MSTSAPAKFDVYSLTPGQSRLNWVGTYTASTPDAALQAYAERLGAESIKDLQEEYGVSYGTLPEGAHLDMTDEQMLEAFLLPRPVAERLQSLPHTREDVPKDPAQLGDQPWSSPRTWGCSRDPDALELPGLVSPTGVGMFRAQRDIAPRPQGLPHPRGDVPGDVPITGCPRGGSAPSSPPTWGRPRINFRQIPTAQRPVLAHGTQRGGVSSRTNFYEKISANLGLNLTISRVPFEETPPLQGDLPENTLFPLFRRQDC